MFPSYKSIAKSRELEEERRLCYVGLTRAEEYLYLTYCKQRTIFGTTTCNKVSRFIKEVPKGMLVGDIDIIDEQISRINQIEEGYGYDRYEKHNVGFKNKFSLNYPTFTFRTAESFLKELNQSKGNNCGDDLKKFRPGLTVYHKKFGEGVINFVEREGEDLKLDINFEKSGHKRLMARYSNLEILG